MSASDEEASDFEASDLFTAESIEPFGRAVAQVLAERNRDARGGRLAKHRFLQRPFGNSQERGGSLLTPRLSYGRHRGPARLNSRQAAVVIVVYPHPQTGQLCLTLTRRPKALSHHGGQICLPGGQIESGESPLQAALREYQEELGLSADVIKVVGRLAPIYVFASDNLVETLVVTARSPTDVWHPDPVEVDEVIEMPLGGLLRFGFSEALISAPDCNIISQKKVRLGKGQGTGEVFQYRFSHRAIEFVDCQGRRRDVWGATAMLIGEFANVVCRAVEGLMPGRDK